MADRTGQQFGNYRLVRLLGRGGFAEVYLGEHIRLNTLAAIKVLHAQLTSSDEESFNNEARTIAHLAHPHIVRVLDFDIQEGVPFLVMEYASNGTLRQRHPKGEILPLATIVDYVKQVADALQFAHNEKLIHRDIKPENMLLGRRNEILLSDFGIATMTQSSRYQNTQEVAGTVAYMAPEQIQGKPRPASDQYALGVVVYEWLSGDRPFHGSFTEIATQQMFVPPPSLQEKVSKILPNVTTPSKTQPATSSHYPTVSVAPSVQFPRPTVKSTPTLPSKPLIGTNVYTYRGHSGWVYTIAWSHDNKRIASAGSDSGVQVWEAARGGRLLTYRGHSKRVNDVAWSPDGRCIASGSNDKTVQVWDVTNGKQLMVYQGHSKRVNAVEWSPDGRYIATASDDHTAQVWDATVGAQLLTYQGHYDWVRSVAWSPDGTRIASSGDDKTVQLWIIA